MRLGSRDRARAVGLSAALRAAEEAFAAGERDPAVLFRTARETMTSFGSASTGSPSDAALQASATPRPFGVRGR